MLVEVFLEELRLLGLEIGQLYSQPLHDRVFHHARQVLGVVARAHLPIQRFLLQAARPRFRKRHAQLVQLLGQQGSALLDVDDPLALLELLQLLRPVLDLLPLLLDLTAEPFAGLRRGLVLELEGLLDVELRQLVRDVHREVGTERLAADAHDARALGRIDAQTAEHPVDGSLHHRRATGRGGQGRLHLSGIAGTAELGILEKIQALDDAAPQRTALQQAVLRLVIVIARRIDLGDVLEGEDVRRVPVDQDLRRGHVDGTCQVRADGGDAGRGQEDGEGELAVPEDDRDVIPEMVFAARFSGTRARGTRGAGWSGGARWSDGPRGPSGARVR